MGAPPRTGSVFVAFHLWVCSTDQSSDFGLNGFWNFKTT